MLLFSYSLKAFMSKTDPHKPSEPYFPAPPHSGLVIDLDSLPMDDATLQDDRIHFAMQASGIGTWDFDPLTGRLRWDARCKALFGLPPNAEVNYDLFLMGLHPDDREPAHLVVLQALDPDGTGEYDIEYRTLGLTDGVERWCRATGRAVFGEVNGERRAVRFIGTILEITDRKELEINLRAETETLETLNRLGRLLSAELDLEKLLQATTEAATQLVGAQFGAFFYNRIDSAGESYKLHTLSGAPQDTFLRFCLPHITPLFDLTLRAARVVRLCDVRNHPRYNSPGSLDRTPPDYLAVVSYLAAPVVSRSGEVLGGLFFGHPHPGAFTERHEQIIEGIAAQAAIAIDNARLFQAERERSEQLRLAISEVHHRVKNSLQSVGALLELRIPVEGENVPVEAVYDSLSQIKTIALVHDLLARDKPMGSVDVAQVLTNLSKLLSSGMSGGRQQVRIIVEAEPIQMTTKTAISLALAVNELLTNAAKHHQSAADIDKSEIAPIRVRLSTRADAVELVVEDAGSGFPLDFDPVLHANTGLELVQTLAGHNLHGVLRFTNITAPDAPDRIQGARVEIVFPTSTCMEE